MLVKLGFSIDLSIIAGGVVNGYYDIVFWNITTSSIVCSSWFAYQNNNYDGPHVYSTSMNSIV